ncbi:hypothetical protein CRG98_015346 [Punica granatum]|uniref:Uncharacterized protein n=1 Tax=Punica granatum TaxID=22663 RepID=A0A2I0K6T0_PUNGR|nr:hypothetical protein CRG98_015346 [Punica granatum]
MEARTTEEKQESLEKHRRAIRRTNEQRTPKTAEAGTMALFITGLPELQKVCTHPRTTRTKEQVSDCLLEFVLVSRVDPDPEKGLIFA